MSVRAVALAAVVAALAALPAPAGADFTPVYQAATSASRGWLVAPQTPASCPTQVDPSRFPSADAIYADDAKMASYGERATGSPAHRHFVDWVASRLKRLPGMQLQSVYYPINRWTQKHVALSVTPAGGAPERVRVSGPLFYSHPTTAAGVTGPLVYLPPGQAISSANAAGKIVVRDAVTVSVPNAAIAALEWWSYDPDLVLTRNVGGNYERENAGQARIDDMLAAHEAGAQGVIFVHQFPYAQIRDQYAPYEGVQWPIPTLMLGVDEGTRVKALAAKGASARLTLTAAVKRVRTRMLIATLPGLSDEKIVVQSHTDGMNAVWDNGPIGMLAMADWFARLGEDCRPRTIQFVFTTGHLYQHLVGQDRDGSAEQMAKALDKQYDDGKVAVVVAMEHMGSRGWKPVDRGGGKPGKVLVHDAHNEPSSFFMGESPVLIQTTLDVVRRDDLRESIALRGIDVPAPSIPPNDNFGGEGNPYQHHLIPTVAMVTAPWTLFDPAFPIGELIDKKALHDQTVVFADLVHAMSTIPRQALAGGYVGYRAARALTCGTALESLNLVRHCYAP
jgi:hypothetical protein